MKMIPPYMYLWRPLWAASFMVAALNKKIFFNLFFL